jgi:hypothetical protein
LPGLLLLETLLSAAGWDDVFDDPKMGWSRWAHSFHIFTLNSGGYKQGADSSRQATKESSGHWFALFAQACFGSAPTSAR